MSKKKETPKPDTVITLNLPGEGGIQRTGSMIIKRGDLAFVKSFDYSNLGDIAFAIQDALEGIVELAGITMPDIKTTEADVYKPDLEAKRAKLVDGVEVKTSDGQSGSINFEVWVGVDCDNCYPIYVGRNVAGYYRAEDLTIVSKPAESSPVDPATVKAGVKIDARPATDVSSKDDAPAQLSMW